jgi:hypothetical protein
MQEIACICDYLTIRWASILRECSVIFLEDPFLEDGKLVVDSLGRKMWDFSHAGTRWHRLFLHIRSRPVSREGTSSSFDRALYTLSV